MKIKFLFLLFCFLILLIISLFSFVKEKVYSFTIDSNFKISFKKNDNILPKICESRVLEIDLSKNLIYFFENCQLKESVPIAYQSPPDKWFQTPTGYYRVGVKKERHISSLVAVRMDYAVQLYEDYFIHEIPRYLNGERVSSTFSGGCIRLESEKAKKIFNLVKSGDLIISYLSLNKINLKKDFVFPVDKNQFFIRQRFNNPLRTSWLYSGDLNNLRYDYIQHAGIDFSPEPIATDLNVYNIYDGEIIKIIFNGQNDHGLGNTLIIKHFINNQEIYSLYGHLDFINKDLKVGQLIKAGQVLGKVGATGYGCNYWRIGEDGCDNKNKLDVHLHFEIKTKPVLESPVKSLCFVKNKYVNCYGYTPENPEKYGYFNPLKIMVDNL